MKTTLLVVGRTVEQHYITAINDYIQRTKRYITFDMEVIPELKNTKSLSMEVQKEKEGELILKALQPGDVVGWNIFIPKFSYTTDNAAMIAITGYFKYLDKDFCSIDLPAYSRVTL